MLTGNLKQRAHTILRGVLAITLAFATSIVIVVAPANTDKAAAVATDGGTCVAAGATAPTTSTYAVQASHGKVMYIDTGQGQRIDAAYVGYRVVKGASTPSSADVWVKVDGFDTNEVVQLASKSDEAYQLGAYATGTKAAYFLLKAPKPTTAPQSHTVRIFEGNPNTGGIEQYFCTFTFDKVRETIKASANKVSSVTSTSASYIGGDLVVTHKGLTGTIGAGSSPDFNVIWISPASNSSWPTRAYRLTKVETTYYDNKSFAGSSVAKTDELILKPAINSIGSNKTPASYQAVYTFKIIGPGSGAIAPVAQISSGTQIKHTDMGGFYNADGSAKYTASSLTLPIALTASKAGTGATQSGADVNIGYRITLTNSGNTDLVVDSVVDTSSSTLSFKTGSATRGATPTSIADPSATNGATGYKNWTFQGPFTVPANSSLPINYTMTATCVAGSQTYLNSAVAKLGDLSIGTNPGEYNQVNTSMTQAVSGSTCSVSNTSQTVTNQTLPIEVNTGSAKNVNTVVDANNDTVSSATLTGTVDSNGTAGSTIQCEYATDSTLAGATTTTVSSPANGLTTADSAPIQVECSLSGLLPGTTYYYRVKVGSNVGEILSFTTPMPTYETPLATTNSVSNLTASGQGASATFNSTVNARGNPSRVGFEYKLADSSGAGTTCTASNPLTTLNKLDKNESDVAIDLVLTGLYDTSVSFDVTGLANGDRYCYRVFANYDWTATSETAGTASVATPVYGAWVNFKASSVNPPSPTTNPASSITGTSATLNGSVTAGSNNATVKYCYSTTTSSTGILSGCLGTTPPQTATTGSSVSAGTTAANTYTATGLTAGTTYYFQVVATDSTGELTYANIEQFTTPGPPIATTNAATNVQSTTATINGQVQANGAATSVYFCYIAASVYADANSDGYMDECVTSGAFNSSKINPTITTQIGSADSANRSANLTGLTANTLYKFQVLAENANGLAKGEVLTFTTDPLPPVPVTDAATSVSYTTATLNSTVETKSYSATVTFCLSTTGDVGANTIGTCLSGKVGTVTGGAMNLNANATPSAAASNLSTNTVYYFRVIATPSVGPAVNGAVRTFTTLTLGPEPTTNDATSVSFTSATLNGSVTANSYGTTNSFCISTSGTVGSSTIGSCLTGKLGTVSGGTQLANSSATPSVSATGLTHNTTYYYKVIATPSTGSPVEGLVKSFTTSQIIDPTPVTDVADNVGTTSARLRSTIQSNTFALTSMSFCISATGSAGSPGTIGSCNAGTPATISASTLVANSSASPTQQISGLTSNTTYYFRVSVTDSQGNVFTGNVRSFTTGIILATAATSNASPVTATDAHLNGSTQTGTFGGAVTFCLSTTGNVSSNTIGTCGEGTQAAVSNASPNSLTNSNHTVEVSGLTPSTTYYFRITITPSTGFAVNGEVKTFTTNALGAPTAQTDAADQVDENSARLNSEIMGGANGANATFCVSTTGDTGANTIGSCNAGTQGSVSPSTAGNNATIQPKVNLTGLNPGTTYYFKVIATPTSGTAISGIVRSFTTDTPPSATTNTAQNVTETSATLPGTVVGGTKSSTVTFCLSATGNVGANSIGSCDNSKLGSVTNASVSPNTTNNSSVGATGLTGGTTYYFRVIATPTSGTTANGAVRSFTTTAASVTNNGGGGGGGGAAPAPAPSPSSNPSPTPAPSATKSPAPKPSKTVAPVPIPLPSAAPAPAPRVTPKPVASPQASKPVVPVTEVAKNINSVLNKVNELIGNLVNPKPANSSASEPKQTPGQQGSETPAAQKPGAQASGKPTPGASPNGQPSSAASPAATPNVQSAKVTKVEIADPPTTVVTTENPDGTKDVVSAAKRTLAGVATEKISGFAPGAGLRIEVIGSRITGQFVVAPGDAPDPVTIAAAIKESTDRQRTPFASIDSVVRVIPPTKDEVFSNKITDAQVDLFKASGLDKPLSLGSLNLNGSTKWIQVDASAETYLPGTAVYLTVTTQPIIFGEALVDRFGKATLRGALPVDLLETGGHSIRIVGIRSIEGVSTDGNGEVVLSDEAVTEIKKFDQGTQATVIISGSSDAGGLQTVVREVPLDKEIAWWTVILAIVLGLLGVVARFIRRPISSKRRISLIVISAVAGIPAAVIGWLTVSYELWIGTGIAAGFTVLQALWGRRKSKRQ